jgi:hypothetical protein
MSATTLPNATLLEAYQAMTPGSARLAAKAQGPVSERADA